MFSNLASMAMATPKIEPAYMSDCAKYQSTLSVTSCVFDVK